MTRVIHPRVEPLRAWAVIEWKKPRAGFDARVEGGDEFCHIYWTRANAVAACKPGCHVVRVIVNQVFD